MERLKCNIVLLLLLFFQEVLQPGKLQGVLSGLKEILITPIKPFNPSSLDAALHVPYPPTLTADQPSPNVPPHPDDLASRVTRVLGKGEWVSNVRVDPDWPCEQALHFEC